MKKYNPKDYTIIFGLPPVVSKDEIIAIDTEFSGQEKKRLHRPHGQFASMQCVLSSDDKTVYIIEDEKDIQQYLDNISAGTWVFHNFLYDIRQLRRFAKIMPRKKLWDTMVIEQIMYSGYYSTFSLGNLIRRYCDIYLDKSVRSTFAESDGVLTLEQAQYGALDVIATLDVYRGQIKVVDADDMKVWKSIELPYGWAILTFGGITFDDKKWIAIADAHEVKAKAIAEKYPDINLQSSPQVMKELKRLKINVKSTNEKELTKLDNEFAQDVVIYRKEAKAVSTYGRKFASNWQETDGKLYTAWRSCGGITARTSSSNPALQNIPKGKETRSCFVATNEDYDIVVADWNSQEPRFAGFLSKDALLIRIFAENRDVYIATALHAFGEDVDRSTPEGSKRRNEMKSLVLGLFYGKTPFGLSKDLDVSKKEAERMFDKFYSAYSGFARWADKIIRRGKKEYIVTATGRKIWTTPYAGNWDMIRVNYPIQASASDAMKIAAYKVIIAWNKHKGLKGIGDWQSPIRLLVHDEIVSEIHKSESEEYQRILKQTMEEAAMSIHKGIPATAEIDPGNSWSAKH